MVIPGVDHHIDVTEVAKLCCELSPQYEQTESQLMDTIVLKPLFHRTGNVLAAILCKLSTLSIMHKKYYDRTNDFCHPLFPQHFIWTARQSATL
jgi:hypothetical protein